MAIVTHISKKAKKVLDSKNIHYEYGYGSAYRFIGLPGETSVDIEKEFSLDDIDFVVDQGLLMLASEKKTKKKKVSISSLLARMESGDVLKLIRQDGTIAKEVSYEDIFKKNDD